MSKFRRQLMMANVGEAPTPPEPPTPVLPYDEEIEYLESTGTQYIDTGILLKDIVSIETTASLSVTSAAQAEGCTASGNYMFIGTNASNKFYCAVGSNVTTSTVTNDGLYHTFVLQEGSLSIDGTPISISGTWPSSSTFRFFLFACNGSGGTDGATGYYVRERKKSIKIYGSNNTLLLNAIPVRVGDVGYLYDKVSGELLGNSGTGAFNIGGEATQVEYLQSDGGQFIDTGVLGSKTLTVTLDFQLSSSTASRAVFGAFENDKNYYAYQSGSKLWQVGLKNYGNSSVSTDTNRHTLVFGSGVVKLDGTTIFTGASGSFESTKTLLLFNMHNADGGTYTATGMKIYSAKFEKNGQTIMNLVPARVGTNGYMFDKVKNILFGNSGIGAFSFGNDVTT